MKGLIHTWLTTEPKTFFQGIQKPAHCWAKFLEKQRECVEELCPHAFCIVDSLILKSAL
jgi:hypothetical protein